MNLQWPRWRRLPRRVGHAACFGLIASALTAAGAAASGASAAAATQSTYPATFLAQSWYRAAPVDTSAVSGCGVPAVGCLPVPDAAPPNQYPAGTLHVGVSGGTEDARSYLSLTAPTIPYDAVVTGGTLILPVDTDTQAGTLSPETASIRACLVQGRVKDGVEGGFFGAPAIDCTTSSPAAFTPSRGQTGPEFTVELGPFTKALAVGNLALALVPGENPGTAWHVAFLRSDQRPAGPGRQPISAVLRTGTGTNGAAEVPISSDAPPSGPPLTGASGALSPPGPGLGAAAQSAPGIAPVVAVPRRSAPALAMRPLAAFRRPIWSPLVFLLPVVALAAFAWTAKTFTRELLPVRD